MALPNENKKFFDTQIRLMVNSLTNSTNIEQTCENNEDDVVPFDLKSWNEKRNAWIESRRSDQQEHKGRRS